MIVYIAKSSMAGKLWMVSVNGKTIHFGSEEYEKEPIWNLDYVNNIETEEFWTKNLLFNKPTFLLSKQDVAKKFSISFRNGWNVGKSPRSPRIK